MFVLLGILCLLPSVFAQTGGLKGKVRTNSGSGIPNANITVRKDGKDIKSAKADAKGIFILEGLDSGNYSVVVDASGFGSGVLYNVEVKKKKIRDLGDRLMLSVDQGTQVILRGSVFYREGTSVTGAKIEVEKVNADGSTRSIGITNTNVSGEFTIRQPAGPAKLRVTAKFKGVSGTKEIEVENAAVYRMAITLDISRTEK